MVFYLSATAVALWEFRGSFIPSFTSTQCPFTDNVGYRHTTASFQPISGVYRLTCPLLSYITKYAYNTEYTLPLWAFPSQL